VSARSVKSFTKLFGFSALSVGAIAMLCHARQPTDRALVRDGRVTVRAKFREEIFEQVIPIVRSR
jgi:hypothetical protein